MPALDFLMHCLNFVAPAAFLALVLAVGARLVWRKASCMLPWWQAAMLNFVLGFLVLALGVVLGGHDGRMGTYAALVLVMGSCQWLLAQGWRRP